MSTKYRDGVKTLDPHSEHGRRTKGWKHEKGHKQKQTHTVRISALEERGKNAKNMSEPDCNITANQENKETRASGRGERKDHQTNETPAGGSHDPRHNAKVIINSSSNNNSSNNKSSQATDDNQKKRETAEDSDDLGSTKIEDTDKDKHKDRGSATVREQRSRNGKEDETSLQMFLSTDNMEREEEYQRSRGRQGGKKVVFQRQYSDETKRKHEEIIRRILDEFDLEETKRKYRNSNACENRRIGKRYLI